MRWGTCPSVSVQTSNPLRDEQMMKCDTIVFALLFAGCAALDRLVDRLDGRG